MEPKRKALAAANAELATAQEKLSIIKNKVAVSFPLVIHDFNFHFEQIIFILILQSLEEQLAKLTADFEKATSEKLRCQQEADATSSTISLANRLVGGLGSENVRWAESVAKLVVNFIFFIIIIFSTNLY